MQRQRTNPLKVSLLQDDPSNDADNEADNNAENERPIDESSGSWRTTKGDRRYKSE